MKKENRHPNQSQNSKKMNSGMMGKPQNISAGMSGTFKPRFIVKDTSTISCQEANLRPPERREQGALSQVFDNSPPYAQTRNSSFRRNWKQQYDVMARELKDRTRKFNQIIGLCSTIMADVHACTRLDEGCERPEQLKDRILYIGDKTQLLLATFDMFRQEE